MLQSPHSIQNIETWSESISWCSGAQARVSGLDTGLGMRNKDATW